MPEPSSARSYRYHPEAAAELLEAVAYLLEDDPKVAAGFEAEVTRGVELVRRNPEMAPVIVEREGRAVRAKVLARYPYSLVYVDRGEEILVLAVAHHRRRPRYWLERLDPH